jgi:hypothetical protein
VYPDPQVATDVATHFVPDRIHIKEQPQNFKRFGAEWTPTILVWDADSNAERHRIEGFLPKEEFLGQLALGRGQYAYGREKWDEAIQAFEEAAAHAGTEAAPEGVYWAGVSRYKKTNDPAALRATGQALRQKFPQSVWAKKGSVWT